MGERTVWLLRRITSYMGHSSPFYTHSPSTDTHISQSREGLMSQTDYVFPLQSGTERKPGVYHSSMLLCTIGLPLKSQEQELKKAHFLRHSADLGALKRSFKGNSVSHSPCDWDLYSDEKWQKGGGRTQADNVLFSYSSCSSIGWRRTYDLLPRKQEFTCGGYANNLPKGKEKEKKNTSQKGWLYLNLILIHLQFPASNSQPGGPQIVLMLPCSFQFF